MTRYSLLSLARNALTGHRRWTPAWRDAVPKPAYDVVIVGGGGHGLATAYYLASRYGVTNVAVLEKGWIGGGNTARNTTIVRSNYLLDDSAFLYEHSLKLWEGLTAELDFNVMFSQRGVVSLAHSAHELTSLRQRDRAMRLNGIDSDMLDLPALRRQRPARHRRLAPRSARWRRRRQAGRPSVRRAPSAPHRRFSSTSWSNSYR